MKRITLLFIFFILLGLNSLIVSQEFHVDPKGQFLINSNNVLKISAKEVTKTYTLTPHEPISISSNGDFISQGYPGSGTPDDPFLIEGYNITASSGTLIEIRDTSAYFRLANNLLNGMKTYGPGIYCYGVRNGEFRNNTLYNNNEGIKLENSNNNIVENNTVYDNVQDGITIGSDKGSSNNIILNNTVYNNGWTGIKLLASSEKNIIDNNIISNNNEFGIWLSSETGILQNNKMSNLPSNNIIANNTIYANSWGGISLESSDNNIIFNNSVFNNEPNGINLGSDGLLHESSDNNTILNNSVFSNEVGISLSRSNANIIADNTIYSNIRNGIVIGEEIDEITLANNTVHSNGESGIHIRWNGGSSNNIISTNFIYNNAGNGLSLERATYLTINYNSFTSNFDYGINIDDRSTYNLVSLNNFTNNLRGEANDDGGNNQFTHNF
ncbi:MAG: nitrous oxide reductase family maturation protein NosD [Candidatus Hodarchaeota archaeon]